MSHLEELEHLSGEITSRMNHLSRCMLRLLSWYVFGVVIMQHCGQVRIAAFLSGLFDLPYENVKRRLRELTYENQAKNGQKRQELDVTTCFAPLLTWVISKFEGDEKQLVLAFDATYLRDRFTILAVSVVVSGTAIPVAWHILPGNQGGEWHPIWLRLLDTLQPAVPHDWTVFVLSDSGLYSKKLFQHLTKHPNWHVLMRINFDQGYFKPQHSSSWQALKDMVYPGMSPLIIQGMCFKTDPLACTLILQWEAHYDKPCLIVTDLEPPSVQHNVYCLRYWIECGFKDIKRGLFNWEQTKMHCPQRAERLWLVISIALLWLTLIGHSAEDAPRWQSLQAARPNARILSVPLLGWIDFIVRLLKSEPFVEGTLKPYIWVPIADP